MAIRYILFLTLSINYFNLTSQNETSKWYFGSYAALDFTSNPPAIINSSAMFVVEGCASISEPNGNLLFYTDGMTVWAANNSVMANGTGLIGNITSSQSSLILKKPGSSTLYYLFTQGGFGTGSLAYSIVDMSLAAGTGSVTVKNATLAANMTEKLCGTKHCNGTDYWIVAHKTNSNDFYAYTLTASGVSASPIISSIGALVSGTTTGAGCLSFSPNGRKLLAAHNPPFIFEMYDFNPLTGQVSNALNLGSFYGYGCAFSPDGTKMYGTSNLNTIPPSGSQFLQWDLSVSSPSLIIQSLTVIAIDSIKSPSTLQLAQDGKIYSATNYLPNLNVIQNPNLAGTACNFSFSATSLGINNSQFGLPNFSSHYFREKPVFTYSMNCYSINFTSPLINPSNGSILNNQSWSFGDPASGSANSSNLANPMHVYPSSGTYTAQLILNYDCSSDTLKQLISISIPSLSINGKKTICTKESTTLTVTGANTYTWSNGINSNTVSFTPTATTIYTVTGTSSTNLCTATKVVTVTVNPCTGIYDIAETESLIRIYPNPNHGIFTIESEVEDLKLTIFNQLGSKVYEETMLGSKQIVDFSRLDVGLYFIEALKNEKKTYFKFIKNE